MYALVGSKADATAANMTATLTIGKRFFAMCENLPPTVARTLPLFCPLLTQH